MDVRMKEARKKEINDKPTDARMPARRNVDRHLNVDADLDQRMDGSNAPFSLIPPGFLTAAKCHLIYATLSVSAHPKSLAL